MTLGVVAITPGDGRALAPWLAAIGPHVDAVVIREPGARSADVARWVAVIRDAGALAIVHARSGGVAGDGVHVPDGWPIPPGALVGVSCHDAAGLDRAFAAGATYAVLSPVWRPTSKAATRPALGLDRFDALAAGRPVLALGGIDAERARAVRERGYGVAVVGAVFGAPSPALAARRAAALRG